MSAYTPTARVALFAPFALIPEWWPLLTATWRSLRATGWDVDVVACEGMLATQCTVMRSMGLDAHSPSLAKSLSCINCRRALEKINGELKSVVRLDAYTAAGDVAAASARVRTFHSLGDVTYKGIDVGRRAAYDTLVSNKSAPDLLGNTLAFRRDVENFMLVNDAFGRYLLDRRPDSVWLFNGIYSVNRAAEAAAQEFDVPVRYLTGSASPTSTLQSLHALGKPQELRELVRSAEWNAYRDRPLSAAEVERAGDDIRTRINGRGHVSYSAPTGAAIDRPMLERLERWVGGDRILVPLTSPDEFETADYVYASESAPIDRKGRQTAWVDFLIDFADANPDIALVFRPHPRMFPNARDQVESPLAAGILERISEAPPNVILNDPRNGNSIYWAAMHCRAVINYRSSSALDLMALGMPTVVLDPKDLDAFPEPFKSRRVSSLDELANDLETARSRPVVRRRQCDAFRWINFVGHVWTIGPILREPTSAAADGRGAAKAQSSTARIAKMVRRRVKSGRLVQIATAAAGSRRVKRLDLTWGFGHVEAERLSQFAQSGRLSVDMVETSTSIESERQAIEAAIDRIGLDLRGVQ